MAYVVLNLIISPLTALWLYVSLLRNKIALKKAYIACAVSELPLIIFWAMYVAASIMTIYIILGLVVLLILLSSIWLRGKGFFAALRAIMAGAIQCFIAIPLDLLSDFFKWVLSYLPRRTNARLDRAAVIVSVFSMAFILGDVVLNFVRPLHGTPMLVSDIAVCTLTAASYILLLFAGKSAAPQPQPESEGNDPESRDQQTIPETHAG